MKEFRQFAKLPQSCPPLPTNSRVVSFSQWEIYAKCPHRWFLAYACQMKDKSPNINMFFGTVIHEVIQSYEAAEVEADDIVDHYQSIFFRVLDETLENNNNVMFTTEEELNEFYMGGERILTEYVNTVAPNLDTFVGCEVPLIHPIANNISFMGYIDKVEKKNSKYKFKDYKTSNNGWGRYQFNDSVKHSQITLYKYFMSKVYDIPIDNVTGEYVVLTRIPNGENGIQTFKPTQSKALCNSQYDLLKTFVEKSFHVDGSYNMDAKHNAVRGMNFSNCKFCEFKDNDDICPTKKRLVTNIEDDKDSFQLY